MSSFWCRVLRRSVLPWCAAEAAEGPGVWPLSELNEPPCGVGDSHGMGYVGLGVGVGGVAAPCACGAGVGGG